MYSPDSHFIVSPGEDDSLNICDVSTVCDLLFSLNFFHSGPVVITPFVVFCFRRRLQRYSNCTSLTYV